MLSLGAARSLRAALKTVHSIFGENSSQFSLRHDTHGDMLSNFQEVPVMFCDVTKKGRGRKRKRRSGN